MSAPQLTLETVHRTTRIIWGAMLSGVLIFIGVAVTIGPTTPEPPEPIIGLLALILPLVSLGPVMVIRAQRDRAFTAKEGGLERYQMMAIICLALAEGPGLYCGVAALLGAPAMYWGPGLAVSLMGMMLGFPNAKGAHELAKL